MEVNEYIALMEARFQEIVQSVSNQQGWNVAKLTGGGAELHIESQAGINRMCAIINTSGKLGFYIPSRISFDSLEEVPHSLSTLLLRRNDAREIGFWCLEELSEEFTYTCMHRVELRNTDNDYLYQVIMNILAECDSFEELVLKE